MIKLHTLNDATNIANGSSKNDHNMLQLAHCTVPGIV